MVTTNSPTTNSPTTNLPGTDISTKQCVSIVAQAYCSEGKAILPDEIHPVTQYVVSNIHIFGEDAELRHVAELAVDGLDQLRYASKPVNRLPIVAISICCTLIAVAATAIALTNVFSPPPDTNEQGVDLSSLNQEPLSFELD